MKLLGLLFFLWSSHCWALTGTEVMEKVDLRNQGENFQSLITMKLVKRGQEEIRDLVWWSTRSAMETKHLIKFKSPKSLLNTGLLIQAPKSSENQIWLFLSQAKKKEPRKIAAEKRGQSFLGSQFSYVDFEERSVADFQHKLIESSQSGKWDCYKVESIPKEKSYVYSNIETWVDKNSFVPVRIRLFIKKKAVKEFTVQQLAQEQGIWTVMKSKMEDLQKNKVTELAIQKIKYNQIQSEDTYSFSRLTAEL